MDAEWALFHLSRALWDPVDPKQIGSLEDSLQYRVNGEVYRFANERNLRRFMESPAIWCGLVRDPVSGRRFVPSVKSPAAYWIGGPYLFENEANKQAFIDDPHKYQIIRRM